MPKSPSHLGARVLALVLFAAAANGQTASLVRDINSAGPGAGGSPRLLYAVPGKLFFFGNGIGVTGIWVSDGTSAGTTLLMDFCPSGSCSFSPGAFVGDIGGTVLWTAESEDGILRLWRSDGTRGGTYPLTGPGTGIAHPSINLGSGRRSHVFFKGAFYFRACDTEGCRTYRSDGSTAGTVEIAPLGDELVPAGGLVFSLEFDSDTRENVLRVTADLSGGSTVLKRFSNRPDRLTSAGSRLFFTASEGAQAQELWVSDGTEAGTRALTDFVPFQPFDGRDWLKPAGNRVYFVADDVVHGEELWVSDGTPQGTRQATDFGYNTPFSTRSGSMEEINGRLVFIASDGIHPVGLWTTTGTPESLTSLPVEFEYHESNLKKSGGRLFFQLTEPGHGGELWATDGTAAGTGRVTDLCPGACSSMHYDDQVLPWPGGVLLMGADDGVHGHEIWLSDGTHAGTRRITELEGYSAVQDLYFAPPASFDGKVWFATESYFEEGGLWSTDGTPASTRMVVHLGRTEPTSEPEYLTNAGGPPGTTVLVKAATSEPAAGGEIQGVAAAGSLVFFWERAYLPFGAQEQLWRTDGTVQGTGPFFSHPEGFGNLAVAGGALYFTAGHELWRTDGTVPGTRHLETILGSASPVRFVTSGPLVFFAVGNQIWKTDSTPEGATQVPSPGFGPSDLAPFQGGIAFLANSGNNRALFAPAAVPCQPDFQGKTGKGKAVNLTPDTGWFWFFDPANVEVMIKVLDGTPLNGKHWVFYGALSSVEYTITVTDTRTGAQKTYKNPSGRLASVADTGAF
jgi:ELWxxDGT repeat protein